jgi:hypothetical protein
MSNRWLPIALLTVLGASASRTTAQLADYGAAQLALQAVDIRAPYLAQMAQIQYLQQSGRNKAAGASPKPVKTTFTRSTAWFKPWSMANEIVGKIEWDPKKPLGAEFAREEEQREALTKLFTECLDSYEARAKAEGLPTDDLAVTFARAVALNSEIGTGGRMTKSEEAALRQQLQDKFASSSQYWTDADKQAVHETIVITTMLAVAGYANAARDNDARAQAMFRETARQNVTALTGASLTDLRNARSALGGK